MVGKLKKTPPFYGLLHRPWGTEWQTWHRSQRDRHWRCATGNVQKSRDAVALALPARFVTSVPIWVESEDPTLVQEMARLKIEMMGLVSGERVASDIVIDLLDVVEGRTLVRACAFPPDVPGSAARLPADAYIPSPLALILDPNAIHIWRELSDTVVAVCRGTEVICWETNHDPAPEELSVWILCLLAELEAGGFLPPGATIIDWTGRITQQQGFPTLPVATPARLEGPAITEKIPTLGWRPPAARREEDSRRRRSVLTAGLALTCGLAVASVMGAMGYSWYLDFRLHRLRAEFTEKEEATRSLRESAGRWVRIERAVVADLFPLEILHSVSKCLPPGGVKLTVFEITDAREPDGQPEEPRSEDSTVQSAAFSIRLQGQAQNASLATKFFNTLSAGLKENDWRMATPTFQPDNTASFVIECKRHGTRAN